MQLTALLESAQREHRGSPLEISLLEISSVGEPVPYRAGGVEISDVVHDSRHVRSGALFCCVRGTRVDGHDLVTDAIANGALAVLVDHTLNVPVPQAVVPSVRVAMGPVAAAFHEMPSRSMRCFGVTGTNGKTTCAHLIESVERAASRRVAVLGTLGSRVGDDAVAGTFTTPEAPELQRLLAGWRDSGVESVAMEVSSHGLEQRRIDGTEFVAVAFTNLTHDHLDHHGSMESYYSAKRELFTTRFATHAAINGDDLFGVRLVDDARAAGLMVTVYGESDSATVRADAREVFATGTAFDLVDRETNSRARVVLHLVGGFNVSNALAAAASELIAGRSLDEIARGLSAPMVVPGRMELIANDVDLSVFVDYADTPDALQQALIAARAIVAASSASARVLVVFGCGGDRDAEKRPAMGRVASERADVVIVTSDNPRSESPAAIIHAILGGVLGAAAVETEPDRRRAIERVIDIARPGDVVVIAGKGHEHGQESAGVTVPFDDREIAAQVLASIERGSR